MTLVATNLGVGPIGLAFDGSRIWTANNGNGGAGSVSIVTPGATIPWTVTTVTAGFVKPFGAVFDGDNVWITDSVAGTLLKLDAAGAVLQTVTVGPNPTLPVFDGSNLWVPVNAATFPVVRASTGAVIGNPPNSSLAPPLAAAFDGQRIMITGTNGMVGLWKAADLTSLGVFSTGVGTLAYGVASDGVNFWVALNGVGRLARF